VVVAAALLPSEARAGQQVVARLDLTWSFGGRRHLGVSAELAYSQAPLQRAYDSPELGPDFGAFVRVRSTRFAYPTLQAGGRVGVEAGAYGSPYMPGLGVDLETGYGTSGGGRGSGLVVGGRVTALVADVGFDHTIRRRDRRPVPDEALRLPEWGSEDPDPTRRDGLPEWGLHRTGADPTISLGLAVPLLSASYAIDGRPLRDGDAGVRARADASGARVEEGLDEHASVGAFLQLAAELRRLGAPRPLVGRALRAAVEEAEHAALCLGLAARELDRPVSVGALEVPVRAVTGRAQALERLAVESLMDGIVGEGEAAARAAREASDTRDEATARAKAAIARDEAAHAALAGDVAAWCAREGGPRVRRALQAAAASL
jgi:hypothetical protein